MENNLNNKDAEMINVEDYNDKEKDVAVDAESHVLKQSQHSEHDHSHHSTHHHRSHHGSHHHHHRNSHSKKKKKANLNKKFVWALVISFLALLVILVIVFEFIEIQKIKDGSLQSNEKITDFLTVEVINGEGILIDEAVTKYLLLDMMNSYNASSRPSDFSNGKGRLDRQVPVALKLSVTNVNALSYKVELSKSDNFADSEIFYIDSVNGVCEFEHLYVNTKYFYRVTVYTSNGSASKTGTFTTADTPRILSIDGLYNVRDIGNWRTDSGKRVKQGLLIRGTEMDGGIEKDYHLTDEGLIDLITVFGIKTDIDLRTQSSTTMDALGSRVEHRYYDVIGYEGIFTEEGKEKIRMVFADLANPDNYPVYLHCTYGIDRTGTVCFLLEALLGVSRGDCLKDYGLSNRTVENIQLVENGLRAYGGDTLKEQTEAYLLSCGVSEHQIESIRGIFLED